MKMEARAKAKVGMRARARTLSSQSSIRQRLVPTRRHPLRLSPRSPSNARAGSFLRRLVSCSPSPSWSPSSSSRSSPARRSPPSGSARVAAGYEAAGQGVRPPPIAARGSLDAPSAGQPLQEASDCPEPPTRGPILPAAYSMLSVPQCPYCHTLSTVTTGIHAHCARAGASGLPRTRWLMTAARRSARQREVRWLTIMCIPCAHIICL